MSRSLFAAALSTTILSFAAVNASAAPSITDTIKKQRTVILQCAIDRNNILPNFALAVLTNTSGVSIPKGATITVTYRIDFSGGTRSSIVIYTARWALDNNARVVKDMVPYRAKSCTATAKVSLLNRIVR